MPVGRVSALFWMLAALAVGTGVGAAAGWWRADDPQVMRGCVAIMLIGGLPHGACDLTLAAQSWQAGWRVLAWVVAAYLGVGAAMAMLWWLAPLLALGLFLAMAGLHFGEDWVMLPAGLLRAMAGLAVLTCAAWGQEPAVSALFVALTGVPAAAVAAQCLAALAPVSLLVTTVGLGLAWRGGHRAWVLAQVGSYAALLVLPPLIGFTLFFVGLHAPLHWRAITAGLPAAIGRRARREGVWLTLLSMAGWLMWLAFGRGLVGAPMLLGAESFRLLSVLAAPHLVLSLAIAMRLKTAASGQTAPI